MNDNENAMDGRDLQSIFRNRSFDPTNAIISFYGPFWCKVDFDVGAVKKGAKSWRLCLAIDVVVSHT